MSRGGRVLLLVAGWVFVGLGLSAAAGYYFYTQRRPVEVAVVWGAVYTSDMTGVGLLLVELTGILVLCVAAALVFDHLCDTTARATQATDASLV